VSRHRRPQRREEVKPVSNDSSFLKNFDLSSIATLVNNIDINQLLSEMGNMTDNKVESREDVSESSAESRKSEIIGALTTLINADRNELIQIVLQLYARNKNNNRNSNTNGNRNSKNT
jgi:hypothetical protein